MKRKRQRRTTSPPEFLDVYGVANRYGVTAATVWSWIHQGKLPQPLRLTAGTSRWRLKDLEAWEDQKAAEAAPRRQWEEAQRRKRMKEART